MTPHWANLLTFSRLLSAVPSAWAITQAYWGLAAALFTFAAISDLADGPLARRSNNASAFGGLLDHATDAVFVALALAALSAQGYVPWILPILIAAAFIQYALDSRALAGNTLRASWLGRCNGIAYYVVTGIPLIRNAAELGWPTNKIINALAWVLVASTLLSMVDRGTAGWRANSWRTK